jgi:hypothetical protein
MGQRVQRGLGQRRIAQALRLHETRQDLLRQRVAMGLLLLRLPRRLLIGVQRVGQAEPRRIARKHRRGAGREGLRAASRGTSAP